MPRGVPKTPPPPSDMLNTTQIATESGWLAKKSQMLRYLEHEPIRKWLGGGKDTHPNYPAASVLRFKEMLALAEKGMKPQMLLLGIENGSVRAGGPDAADGALVALETPVDAQEGALVRRAAEMTVGDADALADRFADRMAEAIVRLQKESQPVPEDRFLTREQAAEMLACPLGAVGRRVRPVMANTWSFLDIQTFMAEAREKSHARQQQKQSEK